MALTINKVFQGFLRKLRSGGSEGTLLRGAGGLLFLNPVGLGLSFLSSIILTRLMGTTQFGIYTLVLTWVQMLILFTMTGLDTAFVRFVPNYLSKRAFAPLRGLLQYGMQHVLVSSTLFAGLAALIVILLWQTNRLSYQTALAFWLSLPLVPLLSMTTLREASLRSLKQVIRSAIPEMILRPILLLILVGLAYFVLRQQISAPLVVGLTMIAVLSSFIVGTSWLAKALPKETFQNPAQYDRKFWLKVSLPLFFISSMHVILKRSDLLFIGAFLDPDQVGFFRVASLFADLGAFGLLAVNAIAAPMISELYSKNDRQELQRVITLSARGIFVVTLLISIFLLLFGRFLLGLYEPGFEVAYTPLLILLIGQIINALSGSVGYIMTMTGHQNQAAYIVGGGAVLNLALNALLVPRYGIIGAAIATSITTALWNLIMLYFVMVKIKLNPTVIKW